MTQTFNPKLDLIFERQVDVSPELIWQAWTQPEYLKKWFTPAPWTTVGCEIDLRPGGRFFSVMRSPEGQEFPNTGCYLEIVPHQKLVWTNALAPGYRPIQPEGGKECNTFACSMVLTLEANANGTKYTVLVLHEDEASRKKHEAMGFEHGWGAAFEQMVNLLKSL